VTPSDRAWVVATLQGSWGSTLVVSRGRCHDAACLPALVAVEDGERLGLLTYAVVEAGGSREAEVVSLDAVRPGLGAGTALLAAVQRLAAASGWRRLWLVTTNDNLDALRFYQRRGWRLVAVHPDALEESRRLKPSIPTVGSFGIPLRDELELEAPLTRS